jgi:hypothetical protein
LQLIPYTPNSDIAQKAISLCLKAASEENQRAILRPHLMKGEGTSMVNIPNTILSFTRLRDAHGYMGHALSARLLQVQCASHEVHAEPTDGLAQGRIVSISRGSPPPKKR